MARDFFINGESLVSVKGMAGTAIANLSELGLAQDAIRITPQFQHDDIKVDAWGKAPPEIQFMLAWVNISMTLVHFDRSILNTCLLESMAGAPTIGSLSRAGTRMGGGVARFANGNHFIGLNIYSPVAAIPWRFYFSYMTGPPMEFPLGTERSIVNVNWRAVPYTQDPWNNGVGAFGSVLWDHTLDT